ncbi:hypothetical protein [Actinomadura sp. 9N407]|uniref:hypothetical protein n=1 Tax=Actinomadura sp. 9N407 TaxID=3375154 RepID=UPI003791F6B1
MIFLGLLLAVAAVVAGAAVITGNTGTARLSFFGDDLAGVTEQWQVFMAGAVVAILFMTGVTVATLGFKRAVGIRRELRDLRYEHEESMQTLEMEKRQLQRELAQARGHTPASSPN